MQRALVVTALASAGCFGQIAPPACVDCQQTERRAAAETCVAVAPPPLPMEARPAFPRLPAMTEPVMVTRPTNGGPWYLLERHGKVRRFDDSPDASAFTEVLDLTAEVDFGGDGGLVAAAFHGDDLYLGYTAVGGQTVTHSLLTRFTKQGESYGGRTVLLDIDQPAPDRIHLGADLVFGPDGYLYAGFGDGGPQADPDGNAQNLQQLRGKILRLDVDHVPAGAPYGIPADNPFAGNDETGSRPELFAWGFRNPWRFSFAPDGTLWVGDVGFLTWEEVDRVHRGDNLGWPIHEGSGCLGETSCTSSGYVAPVTEYKHPPNGAAVVGGRIYRGHAVPSLTGRYIFGDYVSGNVWALSAAGEPQLVASTGRRIDSFAETSEGELLIVDFGGAIVRLDPGPPPSPDTIADRLSATGCFLASDPTQPSPRMTAYDVRVPFFSDGAEKRRFLALPDGENAAVTSEGRVVLPVGAVLAKQFFLGDHPVETRLLMKYGDGLWAGYSYAWNAEGSEAFLAPAEESSQTFGPATWIYPGRSACLGCHNVDQSLGLDVLQGNVEPLRGAGLLVGDAPATAPLPTLDGDAPLSDRARAYLQVNCAICHTRSGPTPVDIDLRAATALADTGTCAVGPSEGDLGVAGAARLAPGDPQHSLISLRMHALGTNHMPPLGPHSVDAEGAALIDAWISSLDACP